MTIFNVLDIDYNSIVANVQEGSVKLQEGSVKLQEVLYKIKP